MSAFEGKADIAIARRMSAYGPLHLRVVIAEEVQGQASDYRNEHYQYENLHCPTSTVGLKSQPSSDEVHSTNPAFKAG